jgi:DNA-binding NarL/FixJ family response regulator
MSIKVALVDDNQTFLNNLRKELDEFPEIETVFACGSGEEFVNALAVGALSPPEIVLMDISMNYPTEGIQATKLLHELHPAMKVVMLTMSDDDDRVFEAFKSGAVGYLLKSEKPSFILTTLQEVNLGGALMSPGIARKTIRFLTQLPPVELKEIANHFQLTERELDVLRLVSKGLTYKAIAEHLFIALDTIKKHMTNVFNKLHVKNKIEAINKTKNFL